jgi:hypothetical protein
MSNPNTSDDREDVLFAFHQAHERPTAEQIAAWVAKFPQFAEDIRAHAAVARDWIAKKGAPHETLDEVLAARCYSQVLNLMYDAGQASEPEEVSAASRSFVKILEAAGKDVPQLARELDVGRSVLADLFNGWMSAPISKRLVEAVAAALSITRDSFDAALQVTLRQPYLGHAKADGAPTVTARSCNEIIRDSNMSSERKAYWLGSD